MKYKLGYWGELVCRNCGKTSESKNKCMEGYKLFDPDPIFRGDDELVDQLCVDCYKNPQIVKKALESKP